MIAIREKGEQKRIAGRDRLVEQSGCLRQSFFYPFKIQIRVECFCH